MQDARAAAAATENQKVAEQGRVKGAIDAVGMGGSIDPTLAADAAKTGLGGMIEHAAPAITDVVKPETNPAKQQGIFPGIIAQTAPSISNADASPGMVGRGTQQERAAAEKTAIVQKAATLLAGVTDRQEAMRKVLAAGVPAADADTLVTAYMGPKEANPKTILYRTKSGALAYDAEGKKPYTDPQLPQDYQIVNDPTAGQPGGTPFFIPIQTATGTTPFNGRTGQHYDPQANDGKGGYVDGPLALRPTGAQQQQIADNAAALTQIQLLKEEFKPEFVGPLAGRFNNVYTRLVNDPDSAALARYQSRLSALKNRYIKAITGAQMSEPEAVRIMSQLPTLELPETTFWQRLTTAEQDLNNVMEIQQQTYTGQRRPADNPATEDALQKIFPDSKFTGEIKKKDEKTPAAGDQKTKSKYQVTVN
jgi:hypothetical protein